MKARQMHMKMKETLQLGKTAFFNAWELAKP